MTEQGQSNLERLSLRALERQQQSMSMEETQPSRPTEFLRAKSRPTRAEHMKGFYEKEQEAFRKGVARDEEAIHELTETVVDLATDVIRGAGGAAEAVLKGANKLGHAMEMSAKLTVHESWQITKEIGTRTKDAVTAVGRAAFKGAKYGAVGAAVVATSPVVLAYSAGVGLIELGQHGAKKLAEGKLEARKIVGRAALAIAASNDAAKLAGRQDELQVRHDNRVKSIREHYPIPRIVGVVKEALK